MLRLLQGITVVELTSIVMGPMAGQILGDLGADVIKVEPLSGDAARSTYPVASPGMSAMYVNNNRNKRALAVDMKREEGKEIVRRLIARADVFLHNMRVDAIERLGFGYAAVSAINPRLVYCSAVGFGQGGRYRDRPAFDDVIQAASGYVGLTQATGDEPRFAPTLLADKIGALYTVYGILAALTARERGNAGGVHVEMGMFEAAVSFLLNEHLSGATFSDSGDRLGYHRVLSRNRRPHRTRDGWIAVLPYTAEQWTRALNEMGRSDIVGSDWFGDATERSRRSDYLYGELSRGLIERETDAWIAAFDALDVPCARVNTLEDLLDDPHLRDVGFFEPSAGGAHVKRSVPQPVVFHGVDSAPDRSAPGLGADSRTVLEACGYAEDEIEALIAAGVVSDNR
jgi:crotonobetainyl-CoA:carnitine CoA-transferase CaiB-like acyl-CoA transferase